MKLINAIVGKEYKIVNFGNLQEDEIINFYEQGIIEEEVITLNNSFKTSKNILIVNIENNSYAFKTKYANEIEIKEIDE